MSLCLRKWNRAVLIPGARIILGTVACYFLFDGYQQWSHFDWMPFSGSTAVKKPVGKYLNCFTLSCFFRPSVFSAWRTIPISMFSASGSEEWLPKLLLSFLVFGRRKAVLNWLWAVMMWGLILGKKSWKYSPAFWFKRIQSVGLCWSCFGCSEQVLGGGVQKWPWWAQSVLVALTPHFNSDLCWAHWSSNFTLGDFHYGTVPSIFLILLHFPFSWSVRICVVGAQFTPDSGPKPAQTQISC